MTLSRRQLLSRVLVAPLALGAAEAVPAPVCAPTIPLPSALEWGACVIQRFVPEGESLEEPLQALDETKELVWQQVSHKEGYGSLHQRVYAPKGMYPNGIPQDFFNLRPEANGVVWKPVQPVTIE